MDARFSSSLKLLEPHLRRHRWRLIAVLFLIVLVVSIDLSQPLLVKYAIDRCIVVRHPDFGAISTMAAVYLGIVLLAFALGYAQDIFLQSTGQRIVRDIRSDLFRHLMGLSVKYFDKNPSGRIITNIVSDTEALNNFFTDFLSNTLRGVLTLAVIVAFMFQMDLHFAAWCLVAVPPILGLSRWFQGKLRVINQEMRTKLSTLIAFLAENLAGMSIVQVFHQEKKQTARSSIRQQPGAPGPPCSPRTARCFDSSCSPRHSPTWAWPCSCGSGAVPCCAGPPPSACSTPSWVWCAASSSRSTRSRCR
jgi:ATP-binding cassette subfamily B multidrug efflux pump